MVTFHLFSLLVLFASNCKGERFPFNTWLIDEGDLHTNVLGRQEEFYDKGGVATIGRNVFPDQEKHFTQYNAQQDNTKYVQAPDANSIFVPTVSNDQQYGPRRVSRNNPIVIAYSVGSKDNTNQNAKWFGHSPNTAASSENERAYVDETMQGVHDRNPAFALHTGVAKPYIKDYVLSLVKKASLGNAENSQQDAYFRRIRWCPVPTSPVCE